MRAGRGSAVLGLSVSPWCLARANSPPTIISSRQGRNYHFAARSAITSGDAPHQDRRHHRPRLARADTLLRMVQAGMDVARLNYSHGTLEEHAETAAVCAGGRRAGRPVAILQDLPGPKLRIGALREDVSSSSRASR